MTKNIDFAALDLRDALYLAILIEQEAQERYTEFARELGSRYDGDATDVFLSMAENEAKHGQQLTDRRRMLFDDQPQRVDASMVWDVEAPEYGEAKPYMSARQATLVALESEKKAHAFYVEALKFVHSPSVRDLFEELRDEEVLHQQILKGHLAKLPAGEGPDKEVDSIELPAL